MKTLTVKNFMILVQPDSKGMYDGSLHFGSSLGLYTITHSRTPRPVHSKPSPEPYGTTEFSAELVPTFGGIPYCVYDFIAFLKSNASTCLRAYHRPGTQRQKSANRGPAGKAGQELGTHVLTHQIWVNGGTLMYPPTCSLTRMLRHYVSQERRVHTRILAGTCLIHIYLSHGSSHVQCQ